MVERNSLIYGKTDLPRETQARIEPCIRNYIIALLKDNKFTLPEARHLLLSTIEQLEEKMIISELRD